MVQDTSLGTLPLVDAEGDEDDDTGNERGQHTSIRPAEQTTTQVEPSQEQGQAGSEKTGSGEIELAQLLPEGQVIQTCVPLGRSVAHEDPDRSYSPECHLDPLETRSAHRKGGRGKRDVRKTCASHSLNQLLLRRQ